MNPVDELLGVRIYLAYGCKRCEAFHVEGLDPRFERHQRYRSEKRIKRYTSTDIADYRAGLQREEDDR